MSVLTVDEAMVELLDSEDRELVFAACGVLINIMADEDKRRMLYHQEGIQKYAIYLSFNYLFIIYFFFIFFHLLFIYVFIFVLTSIAPKLNKPEL